jgi:hypothetical protein
VPSTRQPRALSRVSLERAYACRSKMAENTVVWFSECFFADGSFFNKTSIVISAFGIVILSTLALLFNAKHEELVGSGKNPPASQGPVIAQTIGIAVLLYAVRRLLGGPLGMDEVGGRKRPWRELPSGRPNPTAEEVCLRNLVIFC